MDLRSFVSDFLRFESTAGNEEPVQQWLSEQLSAFGFETYEWHADADRLSSHPSFPDDPDDILVAGRPSVGGVLEFGDPDAGPTIVLNGHIDVVPAATEHWDSDPFEPVWIDDGETLTARGAADMKTGTATCLAAAIGVRDAVESGSVKLDGRIVVEAVAGEEDGGIGAAAAALDNPYPFDRDAAIIAEPTSLRPIIATEGSLMVRLELQGRSAHAASAWHGVDVLDKFENIRAAIKAFETGRNDAVEHPLYQEFPRAVPIVVGTVSAGSWASTVPAELTAEIRVGVGPGETVADVESELRSLLNEVAEADAWLSEHPPTLERFSVQFEPAVIDPDEPILTAVQTGMNAIGNTDIEPKGATYGTDARHYIGAGIPTVVFGPGDIDQAHYPNETIEWTDVEQAQTAIEQAAIAYLQAESV